MGWRGATGDAASERPGEARRSGKRGPKESDEEGRGAAFGRGREEEVKPKATRDRKGQERPGEEELEDREVR